MAIGEEVNIGAVRRICFLALTGGVGDRWTVEVGVGADVFVSSSCWKLIVAGVGAGAVSIVGGAVSRGGGCGWVGCLRGFLLFLSGFFKTAQVS